MGLINKDNIKNVRRNKWPNPYNLTEKDAVDKIEGYPLEIITLILKTIELYRDYNDHFDLSNLQKNGLDCAFGWAATPQDHSFWSSIYEKNFDIFYEMYTPKKLEEYLHEKPE